MYVILLSIQAHNNCQERKRNEHGLRHIGLIISCWPADRVLVSIFQILTAALRVNIGSCFRPPASDRLCRSVGLRVPFEVSSERAATTHAGSSAVPSRAQRQPLDAHNDRSVTFACC